MRTSAVFLSYASQDAEAARHICNALRAAGVEVWLDRSAPRGLMIMALALPTAYTAIFEIYLAEKADRSLSRQYRHMLSLFGFAAQQLRSARSTTEKLGILRALAMPA